MSRPPTRYWQPPGETIERLAENRATGALHGEAGTVHLSDGWVVNVESDLTPGLAKLLTVCGRIPSEVWQETVRTSGPDCRVGRTLLEQGRLTRGELEICHLEALYDAAFFVLCARSTMTWFEPGARHWLGPVRRVSARTLRRESVRRRDVLERIWPWPQLDSSPVVPVPAAAAVAPAAVPAAPAGHRGGAARTRVPRPNRRQRELLAHADGRRTPGDLARLLGRSAFGTAADVRRLAAAGLVATPYEPVAPPTRTVAPLSVPAPGPAAVARPAVGDAAARADRTPAEVRRDSQVDTDTVELTLAGLERRVPGVALAAVPGGLAAARRLTEPRPTRRPSHAAAQPLSVTDPDIALLHRVRIALEARL
ncbi:hypothetical protein [Kitasatospora sp. NPDC057015]|uniref:hypothetical protein n=1 Tax=Kitasatospora sp. NPDC057015 TaxID=3346001 RepID=UPI0036406570